MLFLSLIPLVLSSTWITSINQIFPDCNMGEVSPEGLKSKWLGRIPDCALKAKVRNEPFSYIGTKIRRVPQDENLFEVSHQYKACGCSVETIKFDLRYDFNNNDLKSVELEKVGFYSKIVDPKQR